MEQLEIDHLSHLGSRIENLLKSREQYRAENQFLRDRLQKLMQQNAHLTEKNQKASGKIKRIISQLRNDINE